MSLFDIAKQNPFGKPVVSDAAPRYEILFVFRYFDNFLKQIIIYFIILLNFAK